MQIFVCISLRVNHLIFPVVARHSVVEGKAITRLTMKPIFEQRLLTEAETATYLGVSRSYLRAARCYGDKPGRAESPPFVRLGRTIRYPRETLDRWIDEQIIHNPGVINHE